jgi:hypothetical protein
LDGMNEEMKKTNHDVHRGSLGDAPNGPPIPWVPLVFLPPPFLRRVNLSRPHPSGQGRGGWSGVGGSECANAFVFEPTYLKRGEGLISG